MYRELLGDGPRVRDLANVSPAKQMLANSGAKFKLYGTVNLYTWNQRVWDGNDQSLSGSESVITAGRHKAVGYLI